MTTIEAISIGFCCFLLVTLAVGVGCVYKMLDHKQVCVPSSPSSDAHRLPAPTSLSRSRQGNTPSSDYDFQNQVCRPAEHNDSESVKYYTLSTCALLYMSLNF